MKFSGKMWLMIILKFTKNEGFTVSLEDTFCEKPQGGWNWSSSHFVVKKTLFLGNCFVEKFSTLPVCLENKQGVFAPYATLHWGVNSRKNWPYLQKHKKIYIFMIFNPDFENSSRHLAIYIILVKIILCVHHKTAFTVKVLNICYSIICSCAGNQYFIVLVCECH